VAQSSHLHLPSGSDFNDRSGRRCRHPEWFLMCLLPDSMCQRTLRHIATRSTVLPQEQPDLETSAGCLRWLSCSGAVIECLRQVDDGQLTKVIEVVDKPTGHVGGSQCYRGDEAIIKLTNRRARGFSRSASQSECQCGVPTTSAFCSSLRRSSKNRSRAAMESA
jgi:hypothetical protein